MRRRTAAFAVAIGVLAAPTGHGQSAKRLTVDDLMRLRTIVDVEIAPDGQRVAYVVSTPSVERNRHEAALFVVPAHGGPPTRLAEDAVIYTPRLPAPRLRWTPDSATVSFLGVSSNGPQVFVTPA